MTSEASEAVRTAYDSFPEWLQRSQPAYDISGVLAVWDSVLLIQGPSQSGKSSLLRSLASHTSTVLGLSTEELNTGKPVIDLLSGDTSSRVHQLAKFRLSNPAALLSPFDELSTSEQFSVALAVWLSRDHQFLLLDDFAASFDSVTRRAFARIVARECRHRGVRLAVSCSNTQQVVDDLAPDCIVALSHDGDMKIELPATSKTPAFGFHITRGSAADLNELSAFHYHGGLDINPKFTDIWVFKATYEGTTAGVRVFASPYPRSWERLDDLFAHINQHMCIAHRIVVHPLFRGLGVGRLLSAQKLFPRPTVLSRSALSNVSPFYDSCGYDSLDLGVGSFPADLSSLDTTELVGQVVELYIRDLDCYLRAIGERSLPDADELRLRPIFRSLVSNMPRALLLEVCDVAHMAGRVMKTKP